MAGDNRGRLIAFDASDGGGPGAVPDRRGRSRRSASAPTARGSPWRAARSSTAALDLLDGGRFRRMAHHRLPALGEAFGAMAFSPDSRVLVVGVSRWFTGRDTARPGPARALGRPHRPPLGRPAALTGRSVHGRASPARRPDGHDARRRARDRRPRRPHAAARSGASARSGARAASAVSPDGRVAALGEHDGSAAPARPPHRRSRTLPGRHDAPVAERGLHAGRRAPS